MATVITLKNGLRIANFSSPHPFIFDDGSMLPAVSREESESLSMRVEEDENPFWTNGVRVSHVHVKFIITPAVKEALEKAVDAYEEGKIDIVLVPRPLLDALKENEEYQWSDEDVYVSPFRTIRVKDRITKVIFSDKFCY
jgi:hypothetical protein